MQIIFGNITFNHLSQGELSLFKTKKDLKALIHRVDLTLDVKEEKLVDVIDLNEGNYSAWIVPAKFEGEIIYEQK
jgi:hypothetical protein